MKKAELMGKYTFDDFVEIMRRLRAPGGCPWDREQTPRTLRRYIVEEAYELIEAIESDEASAMCEESGDLLLQVVFLAQIASEKGDYDIARVIDGICSKLVVRHPHVFGDEKVANSDEVLKNWEAIKAGQRVNAGVDASVMAGIPRGMPALLRAYRMQERAGKRGFDWPAGDVASVRGKVCEETAELDEAIALNDTVHVGEELGDVLFALVNLARHLGFDPEERLHAACAKFQDRFRDVEHSVAETGRAWDTFSLEELDLFWREAKTKRQKEELS